MTLVVIWVFVCVHIGLLTNNFIANETNIDLKIYDARLLEFPAVTICNANPIKKSALQALADTNNQLRQLLALDNSGYGKDNRRRKRSK